ncbi:signal recognition particle SRP19 subunit [Fomitopsis schrenkii]|uniref:Signal recognition particle SRP19 subunit n=1 Tax=Fomitopsis schrenkii TaxID=2126942 RepID=S8FG66_FOMSC|nr:signal recognition particle SRP19 subunit [Fomitopsis schrenkii]
MSRRAAVVEEFDDDTDLPLPNRPLPNKGLRGAILAELSDEDESDDDVPPLRNPTAGPASPSQTQFKAPVPEQGSRTVTDITPYKKWTCVYPIYIDAKRPHGTGERRISRAKSLWWPLSRDIAEAATRLGLGTLHEMNKAHPRDWENPGRVRVQWKKDGRLVDPGIKTKKQLLERIAYQIQLVKPDNAPIAPYNTTAQSTPESAAPATPSKGKHPASAKTPKTTGATNVSISTSKPPLQSKGRPKPPSPPQPHPPLTSRVSPYSPAIPSGVLIETLKAGMSAQEGAPAIGGGGGKGKRKVVRVRG